MKMFKLAALLFLYGFDVLLLGLLEKLVNGLIKKLTAFSIAVHSAAERVNQKRAALQPQAENA